MDEFIQALILPALQKLPVQVTLHAVMDQIGIDLDGDFLIRYSGIDNAHLFQIAEIGWAAILGHAEIVDKLFGDLQRSRFRFLRQKLALDKSGNIPAVPLAAMGMAFGNTILDQLIRRRISGLLQITGDFFYLRLFRGKGRGQLPDLLHTEGDVHRDFFFRVRMIQEGLKQSADFLPLNGVVKLLGNIFQRLGVIFAIAHAGTVKLAYKAQHLGGQLRVGVCQFFFLRRFLYPGRHGEHRRVLGGGNGHFRSVSNPLDFLPHRLGHFLIINRHRAIRRDVGNRFVVPVFFLQPVPHSKPISQMAIAQVVGFRLRRDGGYRLLVLRKEREGSLPEGGEVFKRLLAQGVHPIILRGGLPNGNHHLRDFFHTSRVVKLRLNELHRVPIVKAKGRGVGLLLGYILKKSADIPGKLTLLILRHGGAILIGEKPPLGDHGADALFHGGPFQLHLGVGGGDTAVAERNAFTKLIGYIVIPTGMAAVLAVVVL